MCGELPSQELHSMVLTFLSASGRALGQSVLQVTCGEGKLPRGADGPRAPIAAEDKRSDKCPSRPPPPRQGWSRAHRDAWALPCSPPLWRQRGASTWASRRQELP